MAAVGILRLISLHDITFNAIQTLQNLAHTIMSSYAEAAAISLAPESGTINLQVLKPIGQTRRLKPKRTIDNSPSYSVTIDEVPVTSERVPYVPGKDDALIHPGTARANIAPSKESPNGTQEGNWAKEHQHQTVRSRTSL